MSGQVTILKHALIEDHLGRVRHRDTSSQEFRRGMQALATLLIAEATRDLPVVETSVTTPLETMTAQQLQGRVAAVPILRAGLVLVEPLLELIPSAEVRHLGMYRDEETATPVHYYNKLPEDGPAGTALILDPMLATGGSAIDAVHEMQKWGCTDIRMLAIIAAPEGLQKLQQACPDVSIYCCACDRELNDRSFILPGLGDAGDRIFGTT